MRSEGILINADIEEIRKSFGTIKNIYPTAWKISLSEREVLPEFDGILAVSISSANACFAFKSEGDKIRFVTLDPVVDQENTVFLPVVVRNEEIGERKLRNYTFGQNAKVLMILETESSIASIINRLGEKQKVKVFPVNGRSNVAYFSPLELITHFIIKLKEKCEDYLKKEVNKAVITYPSAFSHIQIEQLKTAFHHAGIELLDTISEPEAIAFEYILAKKENKQDSYVIGVFDCGRDSTHLTMLEVVEKQKNKQRVIEVNVLAADEDRTFGGDNLIDIMIEIIAKKINNNEDIHRENSCLENLQLYYKEEEMRNEEMIKLMASKGIDWEKIVRVNRIGLWERAKEIKIQFSDIENTEINTSFGLSFVNEKKEVKPVNFVVKVRRAEFEHRIHDKIFEITEKFKRMSKKTGKDFDLILMHGISSKIPLIYRVFSDNFIHPLKYAKDLEKSAVVGALEYFEFLESAESVRLILDGREKIRSPIGIIIHDLEERRKFLEIFSRGTVIPTGQIKIDFPLKRRMFIAVYRNKGTHEYIDEAPIEFDYIKRIYISIPREINDEQIKDIELYMEVNKELEPRLSIRYGDFYKQFA